MEKLDKKDKKILESINSNARLSVSQISRKTGIPRDSVHYRLQRLIKEKIIRFFHTVLNPDKLGYPIFTYVNFILYNFDQKKEEEFYKSLSGMKNVVYVAKTTGKWDCITAISAKNLAHLDEVLRNIRMKHSGIIKEIETASILKEYKYDYMADLVE